MTLHQYIIKSMQSLTSSEKSLNLIVIKAP